MSNVPTDKEILAYDNVPVSVAAKYIGWNPQTLRNAIASSRVPFALCTKRLNSYAFNISPGGLVQYKRSGFLMECGKRGNSCESDES